MTPEQLRAATGCSAEAAATFAGLLTQACAAYEINTPARLAAFLAQVGHESGGFARLVESLDYSVDGLLSTFGRHRISEADARRLGRAPGRPADQRQIANLVYGGEWGARELGNIKPEDGWFYRGGGLKQVTGRANHAAARDGLRAKLGAEVPDFEADPDALRTPRWAAWAAAEFWHRNRCNAHADAGDFIALTRRINGGTNGLADRQARWERAKRALGVTGTTEDHMLLPAIAKAALAVITPNVPTLGKLFGSGSDVAERNIKAAEVALQVVQAATGATNAQDAAERVARDPAAAQAAERAVREHWLEISEAGGGGMEGAHRRSLEIAASGAPLWHNPALLVSAVLLLFPLLMLVDFLFVNPELYGGELRTQIVTAILGVILMVGGYWIGTSFSSAEKDKRPR